MTATTKVQLALLIISLVGVNGQFSKCPEYAKNETLKKVNECWSSKDLELAQLLGSGTTTLENILCKTIEAKGDCQHEILSKDKDCFSELDIEDQFMDFLKEIYWDVFRQDTLGRKFMNNCPYLRNLEERFMIWKTGSLTCTYGDYYRALNIKSDCEDKVQEDIDNGNVVLGFLNGDAYDTFYTNTRCKNQDDYAKCQFELYKTCNYQEKAVRSVEKNDLITERDWEKDIIANVPSFRFANCDMTIGNGYDQVAPKLGLSATDNGDDPDSDYEFLSGSLSRSKRSLNSDGQSMHFE
jgi:hypothetical protein